MPVSPTRLRFLDRENKILVKDLKELRVNEVFSNIPTPFTDSAMAAALGLQQELLKLQGMLPDLFNLIDSGLFNTQRLVSILSGLDFSSDALSGMGAFFNSLSGLPDAAANAFVSALWEGVLDKVMLDPALIAASGLNPEQLVEKLIADSAKDFLNKAVEGRVDPEDLLKLPGVLNPGTLKPDEVDAFKELIDTIPAGPLSSSSGSSGTAPQPVSGATPESEKWRVFPKLYACFLREYCDRWLERTFYKTFPLAALTADNSAGVGSFLSDHLGRSPMFSLAASACAVQTVHWQCTAALREAHASLSSPALQWGKISSFCDRMITSALSGTGRSATLAGADKAMVSTLAGAHSAYSQYQQATPEKAPALELNYHTHNAVYSGLHKSAVSESSAFVDQYIQSFPVQEMPADQRVGLGKAVMCALLRCVQALEAGARTREPHEQRALLALACTITQHFYGRTRSSAVIGYYRNEHFAKNLAALVTMMRQNPTLSSDQVPQKEEDAKMKQYFNYCLGKIPSSAGVGYFESNSFYDTFSDFFAFSHAGVSFHDLAWYLKTQPTEGLIVG